MKIITHWNINGFDSKEQLEIYQDQNKRDILCLNETKTTNRTNLEIDRFTLAARRDRTTMSKGGVAILVRNYIDATEVDLDTLNDLLSRHKHTILMGDFNAYHPTWRYKQPNARGRTMKTHVQGLQPASTEPLQPASLSQSLNRLSLNTGSSIGNTIIMQEHHQN